MKEYNSETAIYTQAQADALKASYNPNRKVSGRKKKSATQINGRDHVTQSSDVPDVQNVVPAVEVEVVDNVVTKAIQEIATTDGIDAGKKNSPTTDAGEKICEHTENIADQNNQVQNITFYYKLQLQ